MADFFGFKITTSKKQKVLFDYANTTPVYIIIIIYIKIQLRSLPILRKQNCQNIKTIKKTNPKTPSTPGVLEKPSRTGLHQTPPFR